MISSFTKLELRANVLTLLLTAAVMSAVGCQSAEPSKGIAVPETQTVAKKADWTKEPTTGDIPEARGAGKLVGLGNQLILFSGFKECFEKTKCDHTYYDDLYVLDLGTRKWEKKAPAGGLPPQRSFLGAAAYHKKNSVLFFGGTAYKSTVSTGKPADKQDTIVVYDDLWEYDAAANKFSKRKYTNSGPGARLGTEIIVKDDVMYTFGGYDGTFKAHNDAWSYDLVTNTWKQLKKDDEPGSPSKRYIFRYELADAGDGVYIFGGNFRENEITVQRNDLWKYNFATNTFTEIVSESGNNITGRTHGAAATFDDKFLVAHGDIPNGGCKTDQASEHQNPTDEVWIIGAGEKKFTRVSIGNSPPPLKRVVYARVGDRLYMTHGFTFSCPTPETQQATYNLNTYSLPLKEAAAAELK